MKRRELMLLLSAALTTPQLLSAEGNTLVGILDPMSGPRQSRLAAFREGLEDAGHNRGLMLIEYRRTDNRFDRLPGLAADLVGSKVDVIVTGNFNGIRAAKAATSSIPIVFFAGREAIGVV